MENMKDMMDLEGEIWARENYEVEAVYFDNDLLAFEVKQFTVETVATIVPDNTEDMKEIIERLDNGGGVEGWEDSKGEQVLIVKGFYDAVDYLNNNYITDGTKNSYLEVYESKNEIVEVYEEIERFEEEFDVKVDELNYPIATFDESGSYGGNVYEFDNIEDMIVEARGYFEKRNFKNVDRDRNCDLSMEM